MSLLLALAVKPIALRAENGSTPTGSEARAAKILIIDASRAFSGQISSIAQSKGYTVIGAVMTGKDGLNEYMKHYPDVDLVIMATDLPDMSAPYVLAKMIKFDAGAKVIMIGKLGQSDLMANCLKLGAKNYILLPISREKLVKCMELVLKKKDAPDEKTNANRPIPPSPDARSPGPVDPGSKIENEALNFSIQGVKLGSNIADYFKAFPSADKKCQSQNIDLGVKIYDLKNLSGATEISFYYIDDALYLIDMTYDPKAGALPGGWMEFLGTLEGRFGKASKRAQVSTAGDGDLIASYYWDFPRMRRYVGMDVKSKGVEVYAIETSLDADVERRQADLDYFEGN